MRRYYKGVIMTKQIKADLALIFVTLGWGISFILTKNSLDFMAPLNFIAVRFITAFLLSALVFYKKFKRMNKKTLIHGSIIGFVLFLGYLVQTIGLQYTTVSNSGFITGFYVVLVPILSTLILRKRPENAAIVGTILAFIGLTLMSVKSGLKINIGDILTLIGAFGFALHIIVIDRFTKDGESVLLGIIQIGVVGFLGLFGSIFEGGFMIPSSLELWGNILFLAIICTAGAFIVQTVAQRYTTPTHTALIYITEPVFAAMFAYFLINETLSTQGMIGAFLILLGMFNAEVFPNIKKLREKKNS